MDLPAPAKFMWAFIAISLVQALGFLFFGHVFARMSLANLGINTESDLVAMAPELKDDFSAPFVFFSLLGAKELALMVLYSEIALSNDEGLMVVTACCRMSSTVFLLVACSHFGLPNSFAFLGTALDLGFGLATLLSYCQHRLNNQEELKVGSNLKSEPFASGILVFTARTALLVVGVMEGGAGFTSLFYPEQVAVYANLRGNLGPLLPMPALQVKTTFVNLLTLLFTGVLA